MSERPPQSLKARTDKVESAKRYLKSIPQIPMGSGVATYAPPLETHEVIKIAAEILQSDLSLDRNGRYYLPCPGISMHSGGKGGRRDCEFMPQGAPTLRCFHESCEAVLKEVNFTIRSTCGKAKVQKFTDARSRATRAAEGLLIGFDMSDAEARPLLDEWARSCSPQISPADLSAAITSAKRSYARAAPDAVGCALSGGTVPARLTSPHPPQERELSVVSAPVSTAKAKPAGGVGVQEPIYIGRLGALAKAARAMIDAYENEYGIRPHTILVGSDYDGEVPARLAGIKAERWSQRENSVIGEHC